MQQRKGRTRTCSRRSSCARKRVQNIFSNGAWRVQLPLQKIFELTVLVEAKLRRGSAILSSHPTIVPPVSKDRRNCGPSPQAASPDLRFLLSASENNSVYGVTIGGIVLTTRQCAADQWSVLKTCVWSMMVSSGQACPRVRESVWERDRGQCVWKLTCRKRHHSPSLRPFPVSFPATDTLLPSSGRETLPPYSPTPTPVCKRNFAFLQTHL